ncbi:MAG: heparinase II/III family protein, partial [Gemmatimonadetes bacterium]|nr:heparinase II/III family protein [Gemmatimonadota bacterium]
MPAIANAAIHLNLAATVLIAGAASPAAAQVNLPAETHPSLLFSSSDLPVLRERIQRSPYSEWWQTVLDRAENVPSTFAVERSKARYAKSLAFAYLMTERTPFAERAVEIMLDMKFPPRGGDLGEPHNEGEVVAHFAVAYDMLHGYLDADPVSRAEIREILAEEAERLHEGIVIREIDLGFLGSIEIRLHETPDPRNPAILHLNNWHIRPYAGLGLAALVLADHPGRGGSGPEAWADRALDLVTKSLDHQIEETDGGYAEGPFYARYAADLYLPYMFALKRLTGIDLFGDRKVDLMHDWSLNLRLPNGRRPNIDDSHLDDFYGHYLASVDANGPVHLWDWKNNSFVQYVREFSEMDAIALYDDRVSPREPEYGPTVFMPEAGDAVFRSDWSEKATYMLLRGEHGRAREQGLGHEHADETSFLIYAAGEMLAVDGGYIDFSNHHKVNEGPS